VDTSGFRFFGALREPAGATSILGVTAKVRRTHRTTKTWAKRNGNNMHEQRGSHVCWRVEMRKKDNMCGPDEND